MFGCVDCGLGLLVLGLLFGAGATIDRAVRSGKDAAVDWAFVWLEILERTW